MSEKASNAHSAGRQRSIRSVTRADGLPCLHQAGCGRIGAHAVPAGGNHLDRGRPRDQGDRCVFAGTTSGTPGGLGPVVTSYSVWRRIDNRRSRRASKGPEEAPASRRDILRETASWFRSRGGEDSYSVVCPTLCDSTRSGGVCWSTVLRAGANPILSSTSMRCRTAAIHWTTFRPMRRSTCAGRHPRILAWDPSSAPTSDTSLSTVRTHPSLQDRPHRPETATSMDISGTDFHTTT